MNNKMSHRLYIDLCDRALKEMPLNEFPHSEQFKAGGISANYYKSLYLDQIEYFDCTGKIKEPPNDTTCTSCKSHFLQNRPTINHRQDIEAGAKLETLFCGFLNDYFVKNKLPLYCCKADQELKNMPDFVVKTRPQEKEIFYFEFKCIFKPFITINKKVAGLQCYSHSLTLDCDEKLSKQFNLIEKNDILLKTAYVYWYDIPCIKGVFWNWAKDIRELWRNSPVYSREISEGDYQNGIKTGHTDKIYLALPNMNDFYSLISVIEIFASE